MASLRRRYKWAASRCHDPYQLLAFWRTRATLLAKPRKRPSGGSVIKDFGMQIGLVGSGRTGAHISRRLMRAGHPSVDIGPSGRVWGPARLYRLMIGADADAVS